METSSQPSSRPQPDVGTLELGEAESSPALTLLHSERALHGDYTTISMDGPGEGSAKEGAEWDSRKGQSAAGVGTGQPGLPSRRPRAETASLEGLELTCPKC